MREASKRSIGAPVVRAAEEQRPPVPGRGTGAEGKPRETPRPVAGSPAEASLRDHYAELRASGLACDRW